MTRETGFRNRLAILAAVCALLVAACGGTTEESAEVDSEATTEEATEVETEQQESEETEEAESEVASDESDSVTDGEAEPEDGEAADDVVTETDSADEPVDDAGESEVDNADDFVVTAGYEELCEAVAELDAQDAEVTEPTDGFAIIADAYQQFVELSPDPELTADLRVMADVSAELVEILSDEDVDLFDPNSPALAAFEELSTPEIEATATRVESTLRANCGEPSGGFVDEETLGETIALDGPGEVTGSLEFGTYDVYEIDVPEGAVLTITMADPTGFAVDPLLNVITPDGTELANDDFTGEDAAGLDSFDSRIIIDEAVGGAYTIETRSFQGEGEGDFILTVTFG